MMRSKDLNALASCSLLLIVCACNYSDGFSVQRTTAFRRVFSTATRTCGTCTLRASVEETVKSEGNDSISTSTTSSSNSRLVAESVLSAMSANSELGTDFTEQFDFVDDTETNAALFRLFDAIRNSNSQAKLGLHGTPFLLTQAELSKALQQEEQPMFAGFFGMKDLEQAVEDDFLDAARGSTDNRKGWQITDVSVPRGQSFEEARMTFSDVQLALEKGTVILNAAGAHIPRLAGPSLACTMATALPCALNLYVTKSDMRTSAPPHTDMQDVAVVQSAGQKHWKVYAPPDPSRKPQSNVFARGKMDDSLPLYQLQETGELLLETTLGPGDVLFIPAGFPHTTSTVVTTNNDDNDDNNADDSTTSIHLTLGIDHHIWELDFLNVRRLALLRAGLPDVLAATGPGATAPSPFTGELNKLEYGIFQDLSAELPLGFLEDSNAVVDEVLAQVQDIHRRVDDSDNNVVDPSVFRDAVERVRQQGQELLETHIQMYMAALDEGRTRQEEDAMTAHLNTNSNDDGVTRPRRAMTTERMQRLSLFRVKPFFEQIDAAKKALLDWSLDGQQQQQQDQQLAALDGDALPDDWAFTLPVKVGDKVDADLGGAFFSATVSRVGPNNTYDVNFFDGDRETGLDRSQIKALRPPAPEPEVDTSQMTPKQLKRWKKQQKQKK